MKFSEYVNCFGIMEKVNNIIARPTGQNKQDTRGEKETKLCGQITNNSSWTNSSLASSFKFTLSIIILLYPKIKNIPKLRQFENYFEIVKKVFFLK